MHHMLRPRFPQRLREVCVPFLVLVVVGMDCERACAAPLPNIPRETISRRQTAQQTLGGTTRTVGWNYSHDIEFLNGSLNTNINLVFNPITVTANVFPFIFPAPTQAQLAAAMPTWENGIETTWNTRFDVIKDNRWRYPITFDARFATTPAHYNVNVRPVTGGSDDRANMTNWLINETGGTAAHEFGHMFGLFDEYDADGFLDPSNPLNDPSSIMGNTTGAARHRHFGNLVGWLRSKRPAQSFTVEPHVTGVSIVEALSNFDVVNNSGQIANDFDLTLRGVTSNDIATTYRGSLTIGNPTVTVTSVPGGVRVHWEGDDVPVGEKRHFGVGLRSGVNAEAAEAHWSRDGLPTAPLSALGIREYWAADASDRYSIGSTIENTSSDPWFVSVRFSEIITQELPLDSLNTQLDVPWRNNGEFSPPVLLGEGEFIYNSFQLDPPAETMISQIAVFAPDDLLNPLALFTNEGIGREVMPTLSLAPGDFDRDSLWAIGDLDDMQDAFVDPVGYLAATGLTTEELLTLGDLDRDGDFDSDDVSIAQVWVPTFDSLDENGVPEPASAWSATIAICGMAVFRVHARKQRGRRHANR